MVKPGAAVIDVGINRVDGKVVGDVAADVARGGRAPDARCPGGVGPMTIAMLLRNTVRAARYQAGALAFPAADATLRAPRQTRLWPDATARCRAVVCL